MKRDRHIQSLKPSPMARLHFTRCSCSPSIRDWNPETLGSFRLQTKNAPLFVDSICFNTVSLRIFERYNFPSKNRHCHCKTAKKQELDLQSLTKFNSALPKTKKKLPKMARQNIFSHKIHPSKKKLRELTQPTSRQLQSFWWPWRRKGYFQQKPKSWVGLPG